MSVWLFDLGNTRVKCAELRADGTLGETLAITHGDTDAWRDALPSGDVACIASVASEARRVALLDGLCTRFVRIHRVHTEAVLGPLRIAYATPANLGVDRFLSMLGLCGNGAALVAGVGTALTIDLLDADGLHRGGRIAPSPMLMRDALHARAVQLPVEGGQYAEFADDTVHALASGCEGAALALIERSLQAAEAALGARPVLVLHGGGAAALRDRLPAHRWQPDAVLRGLARWHALRIA
ncbi:MAG: type III pantothenate kinase [Thermomonas sp.]|uniref:type III pantothenate kinase n=1 Tax=Thermomonas sp. TaxID=1971895 RepID=UPI0039E55AA9